MLVFTAHSYQIVIELAKQVVELTKGRITEVGIAYYGLVWPIIYYSHYFSGVCRRSVILSDSAREKNGLSRLLLFGTTAMVQPPRI